MHDGSSLSDAMVIAIRGWKRLFRSVGLAPLLSSEPARRLRKTLFQIRLDDVIEISDALNAAGVGWWLTGGWGIDALLGSQTRPHEDVDICVNASNESSE